MGHRLPGPASACSLSTHQPRAVCNGPGDQHARHDTARRPPVLAVGAHRAPGHCPLVGRDGAVVGLAAGGVGPASLDRLCGRDRAVGIHTRLCHIRLGPDPQLRPGGRTGRGASRSSNSVDAGGRQNDGGPLKVRGMDGSLRQPFWSTSGRARHRDLRRSRLRPRLYGGPARPGDLHSRGGHTRRSSPTTVTQAPHRPPAQEFPANPCGGK
jgi:hypothetical protein